MWIKLLNYLLNYLIDANLKNMAWLDVVIWYFIVAGVDLEELTRVVTAMRKLLLLLYMM